MPGIRGINNKTADRPPKQHPVVNTTTKGSDIMRKHTLAIYAGLALASTAMPAFAAPAFAVTDSGSLAAPDDQAAPAAAPAAPAAPAAAPAASSAVATPAFSGPLSPNAHPLTVNAGPFGDVTVTGQVSGIGLLQSHVTSVPGTVTSDTAGDLSNAQIEIQTTTGPVQFYLQAGAYSIPSLGAAYVRSGDTLNLTYGAVPVAYAKVVLSPDINIIGGFLPTLVGAEATFTFQNMNVERGLLWNQEPVISRGAQINYSHGKLSAALSVNDGYFSGKFNWISGNVAYAFDASNTLTFVGASKLSESYHSTFATPLVQNNSSIFNVIYSYSSGNLALTPYVQYSHVGRNDALGINTAADNYGAALLAKYTLPDGFALAGRVEYVKSSGTDCGARGACVTTNTLYGPHSDAFSLTLTPTYQKGIFFARAEVSYTKIDTLGAGLGFGTAGDQTDQFRGLVEAGFLF